jgi:hypothetical protein
MTTLTLCSGYAAANGFHDWSSMAPLPAPLERGGHQVALSTIGCLDQIFVQSQAHRQAQKTMWPQGKKAFVPAVEQRILFTSASVFS